MSSKKTINNEFPTKEIVIELNGKLNNIKYSYNSKEYKSIEDNELLNKKAELKKEIKKKKFFIFKKSRCKIFNNKYKIILKKITINFFAIIFNLIAFFLYYLSLEGCFDIQSQCIPLLSTMFLGRILIFGILSSLILAIELHLIINQKIYIYHIIYIIIFYIIIYRYDHGTKLDYHGLYNFIFTIFFILIFSIIIGIINLIIYIKRSKNQFYRYLFLIFVFYIVLKIILFYLSLKDSCKNWDKGLNSTVLNNSFDDYNCNIIYPKKCYLYNLNDFFDISYYLHKKCSINDSQEKEHNNFIKYLKLDKNLTSISKMNHFGIPKTVNNPLLRTMNLDYFKIHDFVYKNTILMDLYNKNKTEYYNNITVPEIEIFYDKKTKTRTAKINLKKNETLSNIRKEISNNPNNTNISLFKFYSYI